MVVTCLTCGMLKRFLSRPDYLPWSEREQNIVRETGQSSLSGFTWYINHMEYVSQTFNKPFWSCTSSFLKPWQLLSWAHRGMCGILLGAVPSLVSPQWLVLDRLPKSNKIFLANCGHTDLSSHVLSSWCISTAESFARFKKSSQPFHNQLWSLYWVQRSLCVLKPGGVTVLEFYQNFARRKGL